MWLILSYTMQFAHYADVPRNVADEVKAKHDAGKTSMIKRCRVTYDL